MKEFDKPLQTSPFIKLLRSPHSGYFYDVNRNEIIPIDDDVYTYLDKLLKDGTEDGAGETLEKVAELKENGYLSNNRVKEIKHPMTEYIEDILERNVQQVTLQLTQECNFRCTYCAYSCENSKHRSHSKKVMSLETGKKAITFLRDHSSNCEKAYIGFYGGEPLLEFDKIKQLVAFSKEIMRGKDLHFTMTTNASLLTDEVLDFISKEDIDLLISIDGPSEVHDKNRVFSENGKGTYSIVKSRIENIQHKYPKLFEKLSVNMVLDPTIDFDVINKVFTEFEALKKITVQSTVVDDTYSDKPIESSSEFSQKLEYQYFLSFLVIAKRIMAEKITPISCSFISSVVDSVDRMVPTAFLVDKMAPGGPCTPGQTRFMITVDGDFYPCERISETSECMKMGSLDTGFDLGKVKNMLNIGTLTESECRNCWAFTHCNICARHADNSDSLSGETKLNRCLISKNNAFYNLQSAVLLEDFKTI